MITVLVVGATGNTGRPLVEQLLALGYRVRVIVRSRDRLSTPILEHPNSTVIEASLLDLSDELMARFVEGCAAVISCLGHNLTFRGLFGSPRMLCTDATRRLCAAIETVRPGTPMKFILMNTVGVSNPRLQETRPLFERVVLTFLRWSLPPVRDNEAAADYLNEALGTQSRYLEWCTVRPDTLVNAEISPYELAASPVTPLFDGRATTRANVAHFMVELVRDEALWDRWKFKMPVIMNVQNEQ